jgi:hypothetical protein
MGIMNHRATERRRMGREKKDGRRRGSEERNEKKKNRDEIRKRENLLIENTKERINF